jgi:hypothetical protein
MQPIEGKSLTGIFKSTESGIVEGDRDHILIGKERHDVGRPEDQGYPIRGIVKGGFLYLHNFEISRWPAGNPETGYLNCDGSPTKTAILQDGRKKKKSELWQMSFGKRPQEELYDIKKDPDCVYNLAVRSEFLELKKKLKEQLFEELKEQGDPRMFGRGHLFDGYLYQDKNTQGFYERFKSGEKLDAGWVNDTDFEK